MLSAATASPSCAAPAAGPGAPAPAALQAQLQRLQQQLSDSVHCASAKTTQGKATIDAARARISQVEQRIARASAAAADADARRQAAVTTGTGPASRTGPAAGIDVDA